jgi:hypothetical protein
VFLEVKRNIRSESERFLLHLKQKKGFTFVLLRSENNLVKAKRKNRSKKAKKYN